MSYHKLPQTIKAAACPTQSQEGPNAIPKQSPNDPNTTPNRSQSNPKPTPIIIPNQPQNDPEPAPKPNLFLSRCGKTTIGARWQSNRLPPPSHPQAAPPAPYANLALQYRLPSGFPCAYSGLVQNMEEHYQLAGTLGEDHVDRASIPQGCPFSMVLVALLMRPWASLMRECGVKPRTLADDLLIFAEVGGMARRP